MKLNRIWATIVLGVIAATAGILGAAYLPHTSELSIPNVRAAESTEAGPEVDVATVVTATITDYQTFSGRIEAIDDVNVRPLVPGTIVEVHFKDGTLVKKGDPLFTIDQRLYQAEVNRAVAQVAAMQSRNGYAATDFLRAQRLLQDNAIAKRDYELAQNASSESAANLAAAQAALETARVNLAYTRITAPVSGRVSRAEMTIGNIVSAGAGAPLLTKIVSISPIYVAFDVDEQTYLQYLSHDSRSPVSVSLGLADEKGYPREGHIDSIDNRIDTTSGTIRVRARFANQDGRLLPGLYARVKVAGGAPHTAILIDDAAIGTDQEKKFVMVVDDSGRAQYREVIPGGLQDGLRVIAEGLGHGERVIVNGLQQVNSNHVVKANPVAMTGAAATVQAGF